MAAVLVLVSVVVVVVVDDGMMGLDYCNWIELGLKLECGSV